MHGIGTFWQKLLLWTFGAFVVLAAFGLVQLVIAPSSLNAPGRYALTVIEHLPTTITMLLPFTAYAAGVAAGHQVVASERGTISIPTAFLLVYCSCAESPDGRDLQSAFGRPDLIIPADSGEEAIIGTVVDAAADPSGKLYAIVDFAPPFIKVYGEDGRLRSTFLRQGRGPRETRGPTAIEIAGDTLVVGDADGTLRWFSISGDTVYRSDNVGFVPLDMEAGCGGIVVLGPKLDPRTRSVAWLHLVSGESIRSIGRTDRPYRASAGNRYGLVVRADTFRLRSPFTDELVAGHCTAFEGEFRLNVPEVATGEAGDRETRVVETGDAAPAGLAFHGIRSYRADRRIGRGSNVSTDLEIDGAGASTQMRITQSLQIEDQTERGALFSATDPYPILLLVPWEALDQ